MPIEITMPRLSDTMEAGTVIKWNVQEGDEVSAGDVLADIETDKATMEMAVYDDGVMAQIVIPEGQQVDVGTVIALLNGEDDDASAGGGDAGKAAPAPAAAPAAAPASSGPAAPLEAPGGGRLRVSPVARRLAEEHGIDVRTLQGSGPSNRVVKRDVLEAIDAKVETRASVAPTQPAVESAPLATSAPVVATVPATPVGNAAAASTETGLGTFVSGMEERIMPLTNMRQTIAKRLVESKTTVPHYQVTFTFDMDPLMALRKDLNEQLAEASVKLSVNDFLVRACALSMYQHPEFNASFEGDRIRVHGHVNIGVAISLPAEKGGGLVVATIRDADRKSLREISAETKFLAEKARTRGLSIDEMSDSTFTISNLGMFGVDNFTAIINPPNSAILAVGAAIQKPVVRNGELAVGHEMSGTMSSDHRIIDGAMAAMYLGSLRKYIENPMTMVV